MTEHGFVLIAAGSNMDEKTMHKITHKISEVPGVVWAHHVKHWFGDVSRYDIIVGFDLLRGESPDLDHFLGKISEINVQKEGIKRFDSPPDIWIIKHSSQNGKTAYKRKMSSVAHPKLPKWL